MLAIIKSIGFKLFLFSFSILILFSSGFIESEDAWLYISVSRNIYYNHKIEAAPNVYSERKNVNFNSIKNDDGSWRAPGATGYSIAMVPAVAMSDIYHKVTSQPIPQYFPLETDWSLHLAVGFMHAFWGALLVVLLYSYMRSLEFSQKYSLVSAVGIFFLSNLFPLSGDSFTHILFIDVFILLLIFIRKFSQNKNYLYLVGLAVGVLALSQIYNISYTLLLPGLFAYFYLLNKKMFSKLDKRLLFIFAAIILGGATLAYGGTFLSLLKRFHPIFVFESLWGLLFSSGKSIFLYNGLLILIPIFWHKIPKKYLPEVILLALAALSYLFFISQGYIFFQGTQVISPIWHGGMNWGTRYLSPVITLGMILVFIIIKELSKKEKLWVIVPLGIISLYVQLLGVLLPYQTQYRGLPWDVKISDQILDRYSFASHIPRFSPLITQSKELVKRFKRFPKTMDNGRYKVSFYDGFDNPYYTSTETFRGFKSEGQISFDFPDHAVIPMGINYFYATTPNSTASATISLITNDTELYVATAAANTEQLLSTKITALKDQNNIEISVDFSDPGRQDTIFIKHMVLASEDVNLESLDMPYVDYGTEQDPRRKYFGVKTNNWDLWQLRSAIYENSFDLWWLRSFYYWDLPHKLVINIIMANLFNLFISGKYLLKQFKQVFWNT